MGRGEGPAGVVVGAVVGVAGSDRRCRRGWLDGGRGQTRHAGERDHEHAHEDTGANAGAEAKADEAGGHSPASMAIVAVMFQRTPSGTSPVGTTTTS